MSQALAEGVAHLRARLGDDIESWQWAKVHFTKPEHTLSPSFPALASHLDPPSVAIGGDGDTPQQGGYSPSNPFVVTATSVTRYVFAVGDWDNSGWVIPLGASGHPGSLHYADQASTWASVKLIPMLFHWNRIAREAESHQMLHPGGPQDEVRRPSRQPEPRGI